MYQPASTSLSPALAFKVADRQLLALITTTWRKRIDRSRLKPPMYATAAVMESYCRFFSLKFP